MNAKYYDCGKFKKSGRVEHTTLCFQVHCSTIFTITFSHSVQQFFRLKVDHAQFKHTTPKCGRQERNLGPLDIQIFIRAKANVIEGNAQLCRYTEI
jgi:hypothetical protein